MIAQILGASAAIWSLAIRQSGTANGLAGTRSIPSHTRLEHSRTHPARFLSRQILTCVVTHIVRRHWLQGEGCFGKSLAAGVAVVAEVAATPHLPPSPPGTRCSADPEGAAAGLPSSGGRSDPGASPRSRKSAGAIHRREFGLRDPRPSNHDCWCMPRWQAFEAGTTRGGSGRV